MKLLMNRKKNNNNSNLNNTTDNSVTNTTTNTNTNNSTETNSVTESNTTFATIDPDVVTYADDFDENAAEVNPVEAIKGLFFSVQMHAGH